MNEGVVNVLFKILEELGRVILIFLVFSVDVLLFIIVFCC